MKLASPCLFVTDVAQTINFYKTACKAVEKFYDPGFSFAVILIEKFELGIASHEPEKV